MYTTGFVCCFFFLLFLLFRVVFYHLPLPSWSSVVRILPVIRLLAREATIRCFVPVCAEQSVYVFPFLPIHILPLGCIYFVIYIYGKKKFDKSEGAKQGATTLSILLQWWNGTWILFSFRANASFVRFGTTSHYFPFYVYLFIFFGLFIVLVLLFFKFCFPFVQFCSYTFIYVYIYMCVTGFIWCC